MTDPQPPGEQPPSQPESTSDSPAASPSGPVESTKDSGPTFAATFLDSLWRANTATVTVLAVVLALAIGGVLIVVSNPALLAPYSYFLDRPADALGQSWSAVADAYANLFKGAIVDPAAVQKWLDGTGTWQQVMYPITETLSYATPLIFTGLCVSVAFRGGLFNIGAQGQAIMGVTLAGVLGFALHLPWGLHLLVALIGGAVGGAVWGFIPGILKARTGAHEVITTIMLNYVAALFLNWLIIQKGVQSTTRTDAISKELDPTAKLPRLLGNDLRVDSGILLALLVAWGVAWILNRSTFGFELRAVGINPNAARTAGMSVARTTVLVMVLAGALAGLGGSTAVLGAQANALTGTVVANVGFDGILVALLGRARPWAVVGAALLYGALYAGGNRMRGYSFISLELVTVLQALIVLFVAAPAVVKTLFRLRAARTGRIEASLAKGW